MHKVSSRLLVGVVALSITAPLGAQTGSTNLVVNGGFETSVPSYGVTPTAWTKNNGTCGYSAVFANTYAPHTGRYGAQFGNYYGSTCYEGITQTIVTLPGRIYTISFWADHFVNGQQAIPQDLPPGLQVLFGNNTLFDLTGETALPRDVYQHFSANSTATGATTDLTILGTDPDYHLYVDDVSVTEATTTPEPTSLALLGTGLVGLVPMIHRLRRRS